MGKFSKPRGNRSPDPDKDMNLEFDLDQELSQAADTDFSQYEYASKSTDPFQSQYLAPRRKRTGLLIALCAAILLFLGCVIGSLWITSGVGFGNNVILENVSIAGVDLSGKTKEEATDIITQKLIPSFAQDMAIALPDTTLTLPAADVAITLDVEAAVEDAWQYGRSGSWSENRATRENAPNTSYEVDIASLLSYNTEYIRSRINEYCSGYNSEFAPSAITVEGEKPVLNTGKKGFDAEAPCQTVVLYTGVPGRYVDPEALYAQVMDAYLQRSFRITAEAVEEEVLPDALTEELLKLHEEQTSKAKDSEFDTESFEASSEVYGYTFDLDAALEQIEAAGYDDTIEISFEYIAPETTREDLEAVLFRDELASYKTKHTNNSNRNTNLKLACAAIDGLVLMPGEQFDYNTALGKRTAEAGYKAADAYSGGKTVQTLGGGICQVSSTLYYCTLIADLQIDTRVAHSYTSSYMPLGMDATVSWGGPDFRFSNNTNYPLRIEAEVSDGYVKIKLVGTDEKDYYVKMEYEVLENTYATTVTQEFAKNNKEGYKDGQVIQTAYNGCTVQSYKCKYDKETDELISREKEALSKYKKRDKIVAKIVSAAE